MLVSRTGQVPKGMDPSFDGTCTWISEVLIKCCNFGEIRIG